MAAAATWIFMMCLRNSYLYLKKRFIVVLFTFVCFFYSTCTRPLSYATVEHNLSVCNTTMGSPAFEFFARNSNSNICLKNILSEYRLLFIGIPAAGQLWFHILYNRRRRDEYGQRVIYWTETGFFSYGLFSDPGFRLKNAAGLNELRYLLNFNWSEKITNLA